MGDGVDAHRYRVRVGDGHAEGVVRGGNMDRAEAHALARRLAARGVSVRVERAPLTVAWEVDPDGPDTLTATAGPAVQDAMSSVWEQAGRG